MSLVKTNVPGYSKNSKSLVINTNTDELNEYRANKARVKREKHLEKTVNDLVNMVENLKKEVEELKNRCQ